MIIRVTITTQNNTILEDFAVEPHTADDHKMTENTFAQTVKEYLSIRFNCKEPI